MLSVYKMGMSKIRYYTRQLIEYYAGQGENPYAHWLGTGAERAGLTGQQVDPEVFRNLLAGFDPTGDKKWVQNAGKFIGSERDRMPGYDLTFSAPKSVSYIWSIADEKTRAEIELAFHEAINETMAEIEGRAHIRVGKAGKDQIDCGLIAMAVTHHTARQRDSRTRPDAQLHAHLITINTGITAAGKTGALNGLKFLNKKTGRQDKQFSLEFGQIFRRKFALKIEQLGFRTYITDQNEYLWEVQGVPDFEISRNSKRSKQIREVAGQQTHTPGQRRAATIRTRQTKREYEPSELFKVWQQEAKQRGFSAKSVEHLRRSRQPDPDQGKQRGREKDLDRSR